MSLFTLFNFLIFIQGIHCLNTSVLEKNETDDSIISRVKRTMLVDLPFKWTFPIQYTIGPGLDAATIQRGLSLLSKETCLSFTRVSRFTKPGLSFVHGPGCASFIGRVSLTRPQEITLNEECNYVTAVQHETSHALGVIHEMSRPDRDNYITVMRQNIYPQILNNFEKFPSSKTQSFGLRYDYGSVMHYDRLAGSFNGRPSTITKNLDYINTLGQKTEFGFNDAKQLNLYYCRNKCTKKLPCRVGGYPNPKNCNVCKCPRFYTGTYCQSILKSSPGCGNARLTAVSTPKMLTLGGIKSCYVELVVPQGSKIRMTIIEGNLARSFVCEPNNGLEVKYLNDKAVSGIMYCGTIRNKNVVSESNNIVMRFVGKSGYHNVKIRYQKV